MNDFKKMIEEEAEKVVSSYDTSKMFVSEIDDLKHLFIAGAKFGMGLNMTKGDVIEILNKRDKDAFGDKQLYEHREIMNAIDIIERLVPPSCFTAPLPSPPKSK